MSFRRCLASLLPGLVVLTIWINSDLQAVEGPRIFAVGDIHADYDRLVFLLNQAELMGPQQQWTGEDSRLVITGDFTDRGPDAKGVMDLLMALQEDAEEAGGKVHVLLGNHEMMNLLGDLRYVSNDAYAAFADEDSDKRREEAWKRYVEVSQKHARRSKLDKPVFDQKAKEEWLETHPLGFVEYRAAFGPRGRYGKWLREIPVVTKQDRILFVHGGIHPSIADFDLDDINKEILKERASFDEWVDLLIHEDVILPFYTLREIMTAARQRFDVLLPPEIRKGEGAQNRISYWFNRLSSQKQRLAQTIQSVTSIGDWLSIRAEGPLWFRGFASWTESEGLPKVEKLARRYDVDHFVVGHTITQDDKIIYRFAGRVILIDTLEPTVLEIRKDSFYAIYPNSRELLFEQDSARHQRDLSAVVRSP